MRRLLLAAAIALLATSALADPVGDPSTGAKAATAPAATAAAAQAARQSAAAAAEAPPPAPQKCPDSFAFTFTPAQTAALQAVLLDSPIRGRSFLASLGDATASFEMQAQQQCAPAAAKRQAEATAKK